MADVIILIVYRRLTLNFCIQQWKESSFADKELNSRWTKRNFHFSVNGLAFIQFQWKVPENQRSHSFHFNHSKWLASTSSASTPKRKKWEGVYSRLVLPAGWIKHFRFIPQIIQMVQDIGIQKQNRTFGDVISFSKITNRKKKTFYYVNTNEIPSELSCESLISSHVKISPLLRLPNKPHLSDQKTI